MKNIYRVILEENEWPIYADLHHYNHNRLFIKKDIPLKFYEW